MSSEIDNMCEVVVLEDLLQYFIIAYIAINNLYSRGIADIFGTCSFQSYRIVKVKIVDA